MKNFKNYLFTLFFILISLKINAQKIRVINNKGTINTVTNNKVTKSSTAPISAVEGDIWINTTTNEIKVFDDINSWVTLSQSNWLLKGNSDITQNSFLGTIDDKKLEFRSNNLPLLEIGRRSTLGLSATYDRYFNLNFPVVRIKGDPTGSFSGNPTTGKVLSALQFMAAEDNALEPLLFTTPNGSFRIRGSVATDDFFEIGSAGPRDAGRLEFIVGDDGDEPIIFKRFHHLNGGTDRELFRVQGSDPSEHSKTRFGININQHLIAGPCLDTNYNDPSTFRKANSTFEVKGSISKSIINTNDADLTLTEDHYTVIAENININPKTITLPDPDLVKGRIYIIKVLDRTVRINYIYRKSNGEFSPLWIDNNTTVQLQSDGTRWLQIN